MAVSVPAPPFILCLRYYHTCARRTNGAAARGDGVLKRRVQEDLLHLGLDVPSVLLVRCWVGSGGCQQSKKAWTVPCFCLSSSPDGDVHVIICVCLSCVYTHIYRHTDTQTHTARLFMHGHASVNRSLGLS